MIGASRKMLRPLHNCPAHTIEELFQDAERRIILLPTMFCKNIPSNPFRNLFRSESLFGISTRILQKLENCVTEIVQSLPKRTLYVLKNHHNICSKQFCMQHMLASCSISSICLANFFRFYKEKGETPFFIFLLLSFCSLRKLCTTTTSCYGAFCQMSSFLGLYHQQKSKIKYQQTRKKTGRSHRDLNSDRWIQSPKC